MNKAEESIGKEYSRSIWRNFCKSIQNYELIQDGDRIAVCISGGKDSMLLAKCMQRYQKYGGVNFELVFLAMNPGYSEETVQKVADNAKLLEIPLEMYSTRVFESAERCSKNPCFLCSRLRRGWLYGKAQEIGCNKIALGHHFNDVIETILMGILYGSQVQTMMPKLYSENYTGVEVIRPLYLVHESDIVSWADFNGLEFIQCACSVTKNSGSSKRKEVKELIESLKKTNPSVEMNIFRSVENVNLNTLISYHSGSNYRHFLENYREGVTIRGKKTDTKCQEK